MQQVPELVEDGLTSRCVSSAGRSASGGVRLPQISPRCGLKPSHAG